MDEDTGSDRTLALISGRRSSGSTSLGRYLIRLTTPRDEPIHDEMKALVRHVGRVTR